jgi:hypothetical protein
MIDLSFQKGGVGVLYIEKLSLIVQNEVMDLESLIEIVKYDILIRQCNP